MTREERMAAVYNAYNASMETALKVREVELITVNKALAAAHKKYTETFYVALAIRYAAFDVAMSIEEET